MSDPTDLTLDADLHRRDPDRWLSSRFVTDPAQRARLVALYTLDGEWSRVKAAAKTPLAGEIRFAWWREALERFAAGGPADHPAIGALGARAAQDLQLLLQQVIDARMDELEGEQGAASDVALMAAAARLLDPAAPEAATHHAARAWFAARGGMAEEAKRSLATASVSVRALPVAAFPAVAHVALAPAYALGRQPGEFGKRLRITWAVLRGRL